MLCRQVLIGQRVCRNHVLQCFKEDCFGVAAIEPERHFFEVGWKMFCRDFMPRSNDAALQERESGLDSVCGNVSVNVDLRTMVDSLMLHFVNSSQIGRASCRERV